MQNGPMSDDQESPDSEPDHDASTAEPADVDTTDGPAPGGPGHLAPDDVGPREWVDASKDPTPGYPGHAAPDDDS